MGMKLEIEMGSVFTQAFKEDHNVNLVPEENLTENQKYMMKVISHEFKCEYR
jgi:hypothetical protein